MGGNSPPPSLSGLVQETPQKQTFRTETRSGNNFRQNIALLETIVALIIYTCLLVYGPFAKIESPQQNSRCWILLAFGIIYIIRVNFMTRYLLSREISKEEIYFVFPVFVPIIMTSFAIAGTVSNSNMILAETLFSIGFYATGSFLTSGSEIQRKLWKQKPENKGKCYTEGLFSLSRNINYFGDVVLFTGWAVASGKWWNAWVPIFMFLSFVFHHIPEKEVYLAERYKNQWSDYVKNTKALVPFLY